MGGYSTALVRELGPELSLSARSDGNEMNVDSANSAYGIRASRNIDGVGDAGDSAHSSHVVNSGGAGSSGGHRTIGHSHDDYTLRNGP